VRDNAAAHPGNRRIEAEIAALENDLKNINQQENPDGTFDYDERIEVAPELEWETQTITTKATAVLRERPAQH
jgi:hypothetical protein